MDPILPGPTLVIGIGEFASLVLSATQDLFYRNDPRRSTMVGFYQAITADTDNGYEEMKFESMGKMQAQASSSLETVLHDLRLHEKFLEVGLGDEQDLSLGVILVMDLTEESSESLYSLINILREKMAREPGSYVYLLCKTAAFNTNPPKKITQARVHLHLRELQMYTKEEGWRFQAYLFDGLKEGLLEAKDEHEVCILMQNFLLALLSGRLAQTLAHAYALADGGQEIALVNSAGASALIYDPSAVQEICATQLAIETLEDEFLSEVIADPTQIDIAVNETLESMRTISAWTEDLCADTPFHPMPAETTSAARRKAAVWIKLNLHFSDLQFEGLPPQEWGDAIVGYAEYFQKELQASHFEALQRNTALLGQAISLSLEAELRALPARSNLYPGGIANSLQVIQACVRELSRRIQTCLLIQSEEETLARLEEAYSSAMKSLDEAISNLPEPPRWVKHLPGKLYTYAKMLFEFLFLRREHAQLLVLREEIVQALEAKFIFQFEQRLRKSIVELCNQLISAFLEKTQSDLNALRAKFQNLKDHLQQQASHVVPESSPFRIHLNSYELLQWAYTRRDKEITELRSELLDGGLLENWRNVLEEYLHEALVSVCWSAYQFLNDINVETVLEEAEFSGLSMAPRAPLRLSSSLVLLAQGAVPALRPDFDTAGENASYLANYFLCADPRESDIPGVLKNSAHERREWQEVATGDPYMILFCRVRQMIPVNALSLLLRSTQAAYESLSEQEQKELQEAFERECHES